jgi:Polyketide synthase modules and related proteins
MNPMLDALEKMAESVPFKAPTIPVLSPFLGEAVFDGKIINANYLRRAAREPVDFTAAIEAAQNLGMVDNQSLWINIGPYPICAGFARSLLPSPRVVSSCRRNEDNMATLSKSVVTLHLAGVTPCWAEYFRPNEKAYSLLNLPKYSWNETSY